MSDLENTINWKVGLKTLLTICCILRSLKVITVMLWVLRFGYNLITLKSGKDAYHSLPSFHFKVMWLPGATAGTVWSLGNVGSIIAVEHLGQGVRPCSAEAIQRQILLTFSTLCSLFFRSDIPLLKPPSLLGKSHCRVASIFVPIALSF